MSKLIIFVIILGVFAVFLLKTATFSCVQEKVIGLDEEYVFNLNCIDNNLEEIDFYSSKRKDIVNSEFEEKLLIYEKLLSMGFNQEHAIKYVFPEIYNAVEKTAKIIEKAPKNAKVNIIDNTCEIVIKNEECGLKMNKNALYCAILYNKKNKTLKNISINTFLLEPELKKKEIKLNLVKRGEYKTYFGNSKIDRKENIKLAMKAIDGKILKPGEVFSFNETTGERVESKGYKSANIISNGSFIESVGGGVCQVSTTLYNACLQAGLEIVEVNPHSLMVSYVEPCFDAMVNMGSSDFRFRNNTDSDIVITASDNNDYCRFVIYGKNNPFDIKTRSVILNEIDADVVYTDDVSRYGKNKEYENNEIVVYPKKGIKAEGYVDIYNKDGILIQTRRERKVTYKPINQVVYFKG